MIGPQLPDLDTQVERLFDLGLLAVAGLPASALLEAARAATDEPALLCLHPRLLPASALTKALTWEGKPAFVVEDLTDLDAFVPTPEAGAPPSPAWLTLGIDRGDDLANWSPEEALPELERRGRRPLTINEGLTWLHATPAVLERNRCYMTIGSRLPRTTGARTSYDARTPALWISNGTGRDGRERRNAPKVGWCWAGNRHTWLGFASAAARKSLREGRRDPEARTTLNELVEG
jgi:hypothetical protein